MNALDQLREIYETKLREGPFPTAECSTARLTDREHGIVTIFLADIAGIASHGQGLASITVARESEFRKIVAQSFDERWPDTSAKITPEQSPTLFRRMSDSEEARLLIVRYLDRPISSGAVAFPGGETIVAHPEFIGALEQRRKPSSKKFLKWGRITSQIAVFEGIGAAYIVAIDVANGISSNLSKWFANWLYGDWYHSLPRSLQRIAEPRLGLNVHNVGIPGKVQRYGLGRRVVPDKVADVEVFR